MKDNEISVTSRLLARLELCGALVTIDAMDCQHGLSDTIPGRGADDLRALEKRPEIAARRGRDVFRAGHRSGRA
jgi:predicted transposase YbfD/YdcC